MLFHLNSFLSLIGIQIVRDSSDTALQFYYFNGLLTKEEFYNKLREECKKIKDENVGIRNILNQYINVREVQRIISHYSNDPPLWLVSLRKSRDVLARMIDSDSQNSINFRNEMLSIDQIMKLYNDAF